MGIIRTAISASGAVALTVGMSLLGASAAHADGTYVIVDLCGDTYDGDHIEVTGDYVTGYGQPRGGVKNWVVAGPVAGGPVEEVFEVASGVFTLVPCPVEAPAVPAPIEAAAPVVQPVAAPDAARQTEATASTGSARAAAPAAATTPVATPEEVTPTATATTPTPTAPEAATDEALSADPTATKVDPESPTPATFATLAATVASILAAGYWFKRRLRS